MIPRTIKRAYDGQDAACLNMNEHNTFRSDISELMQTNSVLAMNAAANRLREISAASPNSPDDDFDTIMSRVRPRWMQSPKQIMEFEEYLAQNEIDLYQRYKDSITTTEDKPVDSDGPVESASE